MRRRELLTSEGERERKRRYYLANKEVLKAKSAQYKRDNPDRVRQHTADYRARYLVELRMRAAIYYAYQSPVILQRQRARYAAATSLTYRRVPGARPAL